MSVPTLTIVEPHAMAMSRSSLMPMDSMSNSGEVENTPERRLSNSPRSASKSRRTTAVSSVNVAIPISPRTLTPGNSAELNPAASPSNSSGAIPVFDPSADTLTSRSTSTTLPCLTASSLTARRSRRESMLCMSDTWGSTARTLLVCKWPIKCHSMSGGSAGALTASS